MLATNQGPTPVPIAIQDTGVPLGNCEGVETKLNPEVETFPVIYPPPEPAVPALGCAITIKTAVKVVLKLTDLIHEPEAVVCPH